MASDNHFLLRFFASRNPKSVFLKITPILVFYVFVFFTNQLKPFHLIFTFVVGLLSWSFFEYIVHRIGYHKRSKNKKVQWFLDAFHLHHHHNLQDYRVLNAGFLLIYPLTIVLLSSVYLLTKNLVLVSSFGLGMTIYYLFYEYVHYQIHLKKHKSGYLKKLQNYHLHHHYKNWRTNFGNTITIWDKIFKTYDASYKDFILSEKQIRDLILKE